VVRGRGGLKLGTGRPATREGLASVAAALAAESAYAGFVDERIVYIGPRVTAWWQPPCLERVFFESRNDDPEKAIGVRSGIVQHPGLVFALAGARWFVFAVRGDARPGPDTPLHRAPYFNVWVSGEICVGNVARPARVSAASLPAWKGAFFGSRFTHPNEARSGALTHYRGGMYALWRDLLDGRITTIPAASLVRHGKHTLRTLIEDLERARP
jgi:PRTRC genetic system protein B